MGNVGGWGVLGFNGNWMEEKVRKCQIEDYILHFCKVHARILRRLVHFGIPCMTFYHPWGDSRLEQGRAIKQLYGFRFELKRIIQPEIENQESGIDNETQ